MEGDKGNSRPGCTFDLRLGANCIQLYTEAVRALRTNTHAICLLHRCDGQWRPLVQDRDLAAALSSAMQQQPPYLFLRVRMMHERGGERHREKRFCREFGYEANYGSLGISGGGGLSLHRAGSGLPPLLEELAERGANAANPQALHRTSGQEREEAERRAEKREEAERVRSSRRLNG